MDFGRQNLTSMGSALKRQMSKVDPRTVRVKIYNGHYIGIQVNQKELTKTFMMISNWKISTV